MDITQFDRMAVADQDVYVADLVIGAQKVLREAGKRDLALQVNTLFAKVTPGQRLLQFA